MGSSVDLVASDGHRLGGYLAEPAGDPRGSVVVLQEIFGVNSHMRSICDRLADDGFTALAPALFDRIAPDFESGYSDEEVTVARGFIPRFGWDTVLLDVEAAAAALPADRPQSVIGFCLGGSVAYLAAIRSKRYAASVCFYGGKIIAYADEAPHCPTQMHFGEQDKGIPLADVETIKARRPDCEIHTYPAGHGFNCDERGSYEADSAMLAWQRTMAFLNAAATS